MRGRDTRSLLEGLVTGAVSVALITALIFGLRELVPVLSTGVLYLLAVLLVATRYGLVPALLTALGSTLAFNWFHIPPTGRFTIADSENWTALAVFFIAAVVASTLADSARARAEEAEQRTREADLSARLARAILSGASQGRRMSEASELVAGALGAGVELALGWADSDEQRAALPLVEAGRRVGTLLVPRAAGEHELSRIRERVLPPLAALLAAAIRRDELEDELVETRALRRSDVLKTALLRAVSHDLRSPITAIRAAAAGVSSPTMPESEREELSAVIVAESERLSRLVENLLELSRIEAGAAEPRSDWFGFEEVVQSARQAAAVPEERLSLELPRELPLVHADPVQIERVVANLLSNAVGHSGGKPVRVSAGEENGSVWLRVADSGPGVPVEDRERIFQPFQRGRGEPGPRGAGLGLAIARGFAEANGGTLRLESGDRGKGAAFVLELPAGEQQPAPLSAAESPA